MKVLSVVGARPQFIKAAVVSEKLRAVADEVLLHTGQHYDFEMSSVFFEELGLPPPDYNLGVGSGTHGYQTGEMLKGIERVIMDEKPNIALVYGDTNSTLAGALAAVKLHVKVAHVEAGLRSFDRRMPEEINRVLTDHASDILFAPTKTAVENLRREGITSGVYLTGDVMYDVALRFSEIAERKSDILQRLGLAKGEYFLATVHRPENADNEVHLRNILNAFSRLPLPVVFPVHPRTRRAMERWNIKAGNNVILLEPVGYFDMLILEKNARKILTDSGGVQKEAYFFGVPCVTLRTTTEWVETLEGGWNVLVGADVERILEAATSPPPKAPRGEHYGKGDAAERIVEILGKVIG